MQEFKPDKVKYSSRKTLGIAIDNEGKIIVKVPYGTSYETINQFVKKQQNWIKKQLSKHQKRPKPQELQLTEGQKLKILGQDVVLKFYKGKTIYHNKQNIFVPSKKRLNVRAMLIDYFKRFALNYIKKKASEFAQKYNFSFNQIKISSAKKRWGACSTNKNLSFTWRIIMAPPEIVDYVIIHELAHTQVMTHSPDFWSIVKKIIPDYEKRKQWLDKNGYILNF